MIRRLLSLAVLALAGAPLFGQSLSEGPLAVRQLTLSNGMKVYLNEDHSQPIVYGAVVVGAGAVDCPDTGIAHYFEHIMFKGTDEIGTVDYQAEKVYLDSIETAYSRLAATKDGKERDAIQQEINRLSIAAADYAVPNEFTTLITLYGGTGLNAGTSYDLTVYYNYFDSRYLEPWLLVGSQRFLNPVFRLFQGELETVYEEKNMGSDGIGGGVIDHAIAAFAGADNPYAFPVIGSTENLKNPDQAAMKAFYQKYYVAPNMSLLLGGDFDAASVQPLLETYFGRIRGGEMPERISGREAPLEGVSEARIKLPIPIIKAEALAFNGPLYGEADEMAFRLGCSLLNNGAGTGRLDSLMTSHALLATGAMPLQFNHLSAAVLLNIPKIPFGSLKKAEKKILAEVAAIQAGDFTDEALAQAKRDLRKELQLSLETLEGRSGMLMEVVSQGRSWDDFLAQIAAIDDISREEVVAAMNRYFDTSRMLRLRKQFGSYPKDDAAKPDFKPVVPKHRGGESAFARDMAARFGESAGDPKIVDPSTPEVARIPLAGSSLLYAGKNPANELFSLRIRYDIGTLHDARLDLLGSLLPQLGTDSLKVQELSRAWQRIGTTWSVEAGDNGFAFTLSGYDAALDESVALLAHMLGHFASDKESVSETFSNYDQEGALAFTGGTSTLFGALMAKTMLGEGAPLLRRLTGKELKPLKKGSALLDLLAEVVLPVRCDVTYTGGRDPQEVAALVRTRLPFGEKKPGRKVTPVQVYDKPRVLFLNASGSRQTYIGAYVTDPACGNDPARQARLKLWADYFGGGMSSILFDEIREYRAYAYSAFAMAHTPDELSARQGDCGASFGYLATQADKAEEAMALMDSLYRNMPVYPVLGRTALQNELNGINNGYPDFRTLPEMVAAFGRNDLKENPDKALCEALKGLTMDDIVAYSQIVAARPFTWIVVGDKKKMDMDKLSRYGELVFVKEKELIRK